MTAIPTEKIERMEEMATESIESARVAVNKRLDKANQRIADVAGELRETAELASDEKSMLHKAKDIALEKKELLEKKTHHVSDLARNSYGQMRGAASGLWTKTKSFARENPVTSTAIAMGAAVVAGLAIRKAQS